MKKTLIALLGLTLGLSNAGAQKIIDLNAVTGAAVTPSTDVMAISTAAGTNNKITVDELKIALDLGTSPIFATNIDIGTAGVRLSDDGDGALTFLGLGNGSDEDFTFNLDDTSNTVVISSSTGVTLWDYGTAISLAAGGVTLNAAGTMIFEGATADAYETTITVVDPTADRTWTIPDSASDTFAGLAATQTFTNKTLTSPIIDAAGVQLTGDGDGALTLLGLGNGSDEDLVINLDDTANTVVLSSTTGVTALDTGAGIGLNTGNVYLYEAKTLQFEGTTADNYETTITVIDPTADRTWSIPDSASDTFVGIGATQTLSAKTLASPVVTTQIDLGTAGVRVSDDGDGAITFLGQGNGSDEDLKLNFDDTSNTVVVTSSTGVSSIDFGTISLTASAPVVTSGTALTLGAAGVSFTDDGDGAFTILGLGNGNDEDLLFNFDDTANTVDISSTTGVTALELGTAIGINSGTLHVNTAKTLEFEGATADGFETTLTVTDPTADRTWTFPNVSDTVVGLDATQTLTAKTLTSPVIGTGLTASGSAANTFAGSTGTFITSTGANTFKGSAHNFDAVLQPTTNDAAALGTTLLGFSDLFLATGGTLHFANTDWVATHTAGILTVGTGDLRVTTAGTNTASAVTVGGTQSLSAKTLVSPVISTGLTASGSAANDFSASTGTFITSTGANTLSGAVTIADAATPSLTTAAGKSNTGFVQINGKTSGSFKVTTADATAQAVTLTVAAQTSGAGALGLPDMAGVAQDLVMTAKAQTLTNKTLTAPVIGAATGTSLAATGAITSSGTAGIGYATGAGGTVTQITSRTTSVTLNKTSGNIVLFSAAGSATPFSFTLTNSTIAAGDTVIVNQKSGTDLYTTQVVTAVGAGSCQITLANASGTTTEQPVFNFNVIKGVAN